MGTDEQNSIIQRKAKGARTEFDARVMSPAKALRLAIAKSAADMFGLAVTVTTVEQVKLPHGDIQAEAGDDGLLLLFDGASGARAAAKVDRQLLTALIEVQTMGKVRPGEAEERPMTRTDAAIVAPLLDTVFTRSDKQLGEADPTHAPEGFRFGDMIEDARSLALALEAPVFDLFRLTLDLGNGARTGMLSLMLPHRPRAPAAKKPGAQRGEATFDLKKSAMEAQVVMTAVLSRLRVPLNEVCALEPGAVLPVPNGALARASLLSGDGHVVARVRLGQMNGMRAVRLVSTATDRREAEPEAAPQAKPSRARRAVAPRPAAALDDVVDGVAVQVQDGGDRAAGRGAADLPSVPDAPDDDSFDAADLSAAELLLAAQGAPAVP